MTDADQCVARLSELVGSVDPGALNVDWDVLAAELGHSFPADYRRYVESYPPGDIGLLHVMHPDTGDGVRQYVDTIRRQQEFLDEVCRSRVMDFPYRFGSNPGELAIWGAVQADFVLCWQLTGDDPDTWPVVVADTALSADAVERYEGSAVRLLIDISEGRDPVPLINYVVDVLPFKFRRAGEVW